MSEAYAAHDAESRADIDKEPDKSDYWLAEIKAAKERNKDWWDWGQKVVRQYRDERDRGMMVDRDDQKLNILWSNTEVLKAALFASLGKPDVRRRFPKPGREMKIGKQTALLLENALSVSIDQGDEEYEVSRAVEDMLLPGRGEVWMELDHEEDDYGYVKRVDCKTVHVGWRDFLQGCGVRWKDIPWVARRHIFTRDDLKEKFPKHGDKVPLNHEADGYSKTDKKKQPELFKRAAVWEVWDKGKKERIYVAEDYEFILQRTPDPYKLEDFFPCPRPLVAVETTDSSVPIPEYTLYQDQAEELNRVTRRIFKLVNMLKVRGVYDASAEESETLADLQHAKDGEMLPYKAAMSLADRGGLDGAFLFYPLEDTIAALQQLYAQRDQLVYAIYEVTGISDLMRGQSNAQETATAQRLKGQFGSMRLQKRQKEVQRFVRDCYRIKAELIAEHYPPDQLEEMTGILLPPEDEIERAQQALAQIEAQQQQEAPQQIEGNAERGTEAPQEPPEGAPEGMGQVIPFQAEGQPQAGKSPPKDERVEELERIADAVSWEEVSRVLHSDLRRCYQIDIETDSTVFEDAEAEKQSRMEYLTAMQGIITNLHPLVKENPSWAPLAKEAILFASRAFKAGRTLEESLEDAFDQIKDSGPRMSEKELEMMSKSKLESKKLKMEEAKTKAELADKRAEREFQQQQAQLETVAKQQEMQLESQLKSREVQLKEAEIELKRIEVRGAAEDRQLTAEKTRTEMANQQAEMSLKQRDQDFREREAGERLELDKQDRAIKQQDTQAKTRDMDERRLYELQVEPQQRDDEVNKVAEQLSQLRDGQNEMMQIIKQAFGEGGQEQSPPT